MDIFILTYYIEGKGLKEVSSSIDNLIPLTHILNSQKIRFKISNRCGGVSQEQLNISGLDYWLGTDDSWEKEVN